MRQQLACKSGPKGLIFAIAASKNNLKNGNFMDTRESSVLIRVNFVVISLLNFLLCFGAHGDALDHWTTNNFNNLSLGYLGENPSGNCGAVAIEYGNGRYVAVGYYAGSDFGFIESSEDGLGWTVRGDGHSIPGTPLTMELFSVTFGNGTFVAVGYDAYFGANLYSSTNGIDWKSHTNATVSNFYGVAYGGGSFAAVGDGFLPSTSSYPQTNRNIYTSTDGINWTMRNSGAPANDAHTITDIAYGVGRFVAVDFLGYSYTTTTGISWTRHFIGGGPSVSYGNGLFISPIGPGTNLVSSDGLAWSVLTNNTASMFGRVVYGNGLYIAPSRFSLFTSIDGTNWVQRNFPSTGGSAVAFGTRNAVVVGSSSAAVLASDPFVALSMNPGFPPHLNLSGLQDHSYRIECLANLSPTNWQPLATFSLTNSPLEWMDTAASNSQRFYRATLLP